ncbi:MAG TPA: electron transport complex subunit RsxG [Arenimonas sp.]|uniref:electron transport complex subunit RsxG n=1 Tax=Arenimonas sp. TaxID=1872635 RepID=UPI002D80527A|nr:electron transport complex subunit RsxG [Arenimonas sp.]HEU0153334.1 electron transport complex subunit RsxG [Arenimonas sp.]
MSEAPREAFRAGLQLGLAALLATALLAGTTWLTRDRIVAAEHRAQMQALEVVLPADRYDNDLLADAIQVQAPAWLGSESTTVYRASRGGEPSALVFEAVAPDGYGGPIRLLVAVDPAGTVLGVRVVAHRETPGLGDDIEAGRSDWITRFRGRALGDPPAAGWAVRKDGGDFDQFAGATVTPRAVVRAVQRALGFVARHGDAIRAAPAGDTLRIPTAPDPAPAR